MKKILILISLISYFVFPKDIEYKKLSNSIFSIKKDKENYIFNYADKNLSLLNLYPKDIQSLGKDKFIIQNPFITVLLDNDKITNLNQISNIRNNNIDSLIPISSSQEYVAYYKDNKISLYDIKNNTYIDSNIKDISYNTFLNKAFLFVQNFIIYEKNNSIYIRSVEDIKDEQDENYFLATGNLNSINILNDTIYFANQNKIYSVNLQSLEFISKDTPISLVKKLTLTLPFDFNPNFDIFSTNGDMFVVAKNHHDIFLFNEKNKTNIDKLPATFQIKKMAISKENILLLVKDYNSGMYKGFSFNINDSKKVTKELGADVRYINNNLVALNKKTLQIFDIKLNSVYLNKSENDIVNFSLSGDSLLVFDGKSSKTINIKNKKEANLTPVSFDNYDEKNFINKATIGEFSIFSNKGGFSLNETEIKDEDSKILFKKITNDKTCQDNVNVNFIKYRNSCVNPSVSLAVNVFDTNGLFEILDTLEYFNIKANFFIVDEFLQNYPDIVNVLSKKYSVGYITPQYLKFPTKVIFENSFKNFIKEFKTATSKDIETVNWHTYYYTIDENLLKVIGQLKKYNFISRDIDTFDWVEKTTELGYSLYKSTDNILNELIPNIEVNSILSLTVGISNRQDYLWGKLSYLLLNLYERSFLISDIQN